MKLVSRIIEGLQDVLYEIRARMATIKACVSFDVPYVCQFAVPEHAELVMKKKLNPVDDPHWAKSGAVSPERYAQWSVTMCGMASAAMALAHAKGLNIPPAQLAEDAMRHGVYLDEQGTISGMRYREFLPWIRHYGIQARMYSRMSMKGIRYALSNGSLVIVSVNPNIRGYESAPRNQKGGHLVLVTGYDRTKGTITINNPSGFTSSNTQQNHVLADRDFAHFFASRGIVLSRSKS